MLQTLRDTGALTLFPDSQTGNGQCIEQDTCECFLGYQPPECDTSTWDSASGCPDLDGCNGPAGGTCTAPNVCTCNTGYSQPDCLPSGGGGDDDDDPPPVIEDGPSTRNSSPASSTAIALAGTGVGVAGILLLASVAYLIRSGEVEDEDEEKE